MITQTIRTPVSFVTAACAIGKSIPREFLCAILGNFTESTLWRRLNYTNNSARKPCAIDVLCYWEIDSLIILMCV